MGKADEFLELIARDPELRARIDAVIDRTGIALSVAIGRERGLEFTGAELMQALEAKLGLAEVELADDEGEGEGDALAGGGSCHSRSGCRSPCRFCNIIDGGDEFIVQVEEF